MSPGIRDMRGAEVGPDGLSDRERERAASKTRRQIAAIARVRGEPASDTGISADDLDLAEEGATGRFSQSVEVPIPAIAPEDLDAVERQNLVGRPVARPTPTSIPVGPATITPYPAHAPIPRATDLILLEIAAGSRRLVLLAEELRGAVQRDTDQAEKVRQFLAMATELRGPEKNGESDSPVSQARRDEGREG